jgi:hypothetical protein
MGLIDGSGEIHTCVIMKRDHDALPSESYDEIYPDNIVFEIEYIVQDARYFWEQQYDPSDWQLKQIKSAICERLSGMQSAAGWDHG